MKSGDFKVEVVIEGRPAREYTYNDSEQDTANHRSPRYVEAIEGASFGVRCMTRSGYRLAPAIDYLRFDLYVDDEPATSCERPRQVDDRSMRAMLGSYMRWSSAASWAKSELRFNRLRRRGKSKVNRVLGSCSSPQIIR